MQFNNGQIDRAFDPLKVVDVKTLQSIADNFKKSKDKKKRAIGVFLDRVNRMRTGDLENAPSNPSSAGTKTRAGINSSSGLRNLVD